MIDVLVLMVMEGQEVSQGEDEDAGEDAGIVMHLELEVELRSSLIWISGLVKMT